MFNVFIDRNINLLAESLGSVANVTTFIGRGLTNADLINNKCDILFTRSQTKVNFDLLKNTNVRLVATATTGVDHIDLDYLKSQNILFYDAAGANANSVAEFVLFSILNWSLKNKFDLSTKTIGIIGFGRIGKIVAKYCSILGLKIKVNDPPLKDIGYIFPEHFDYLEIDELCKSSDIVTNHIPLVSDGQYKTINLINENLISKIKPNSCFIHHSRGSVVDEISLIKFKKINNLYCSIDVWKNEPNINIDLVEISEIATPHISGYSYDGKLNGTNILLSIFENFTKIVPDYSLVESELSKTCRKNINDFKNINELTNYLNSNRKFTEDIENFKKITTMASKSEYFDYLRKSYSNKRECLNN